MDRGAKSPGTWPRHATPICPHHKLDFRNTNVKLNLVEKIKFDRKCWIVGARRPPASQNGLPFKFCSPLEVLDFGG